MAKRRVPAALHHELSEYASLLRALRVRDAMDLTKHLVKPTPFSLNIDKDSSCTPGAGPSDLSHPSNVQTETKSAKARGKQKVTAAPPQQVRRDHWTRWPLPLEDVLLPEWTLEDEVTVIASQVLKARSPVAFPCPITSPDDFALMDDEDEDERVVKVMDMEVDSDDPDPPYYVPYITSVVAKYLSTIFAILASHTPARPASMQNRIEPLNWRAVIDVVVSCGIPEFTNTKVVENVIKRMEALYGPSILPLEGTKATSFRAIERMKGKDAQTEAFEKLFEKDRNTYFNRITPPPSLFLRRSPEIEIPVKKRLTKREKKEEAPYKARKHWTPKDQTAKTKSKPRPKPKTSKKKSLSAQDADSVEQTPPAPDIESTLPPESSQPVRRSTRTRKTNVSYREVPPDDNLLL